MTGDRVGGGGRSGDTSGGTGGDPTPVAAGTATARGRAGTSSAGTGARGGGTRARWVLSSASKSSIRRFVITEKAPTRAFSWLKAATTAFTFKTLLKHYAKRALTPRSLNVKSGVKALVGAFNQEKALVGAFSVIVKTDFETDGSSTALVWTR